MSPRSRFLLAALIAVSGAFAIIALVMRVFDPPQRIEDAVYAELTTGVGSVDLDADPALRKALQDSLAGKAVKPGAPPPKPSFEITPRQVKGFVQIEVRLDASGRVADAKVVGAMPPGVYEQRALQQVRAQRHAPIIKDGKAVAGQVTEVVRFSVPADAKPER